MKKSVMKVDTTIPVDVLVIGGGGAGVRAAIEADCEGATVALISKGPVTRSGLTPQAFTSYQAPFDPRDSAALHFKDTVHHGRDLGDQNLVRAMADEAVPRALELHRWGVPFKMEGDTFFMVFHPGQTYPRNLLIQGGGYAMMVRLKKELNRHRAVKVFEDYMVTRLLMSDGEVVGAVAVDQREGRLVAFQAKAVILATGGYERLWGKTDAAPDSTGDGTSLGLMAGATLADMELMLFYPTLYFYTEGEQGLVVVYEWFLEERYLAATLVNARGQEFLPKRPLLRDELSELIFREVAAGRGTEQGGVFIDVSRSPKSREEKEKVYRELIAGPGRNLKNYGIDVTKDLIEIAPGAHFSLGGVHINERCETDVPGLYAAGEVAANLHGANRVSGNALTETQVFGARAGKFASQHAKGSPSITLPTKQVEEEMDRIRNVVDGRGDRRPSEVRRKLQGVMDRFVSPVRSVKGLSEALKEIEAMKADDLIKLKVVDQARFNYDLRDALQLMNLVSLAEVVIRSAMMRQETRGHHLFSEYPEPRKEWCKHTAVRLKANVPSYSTIPVVTL
jgi:succinate dehydrogenase/fumarate reductase flavoprotein subunit